MRGPAELLPQLRGIAEDAADVALSWYGRDDLRVTDKADASPVTAADEATGVFICERLATLTPGVEIVCEETAGDSAAARTGEFWLVDPLDGTKEFIRRTGEFTINIALVRAGVPVMGVVHVPVSGVSYVAASGTGAMRSGRGTAGFSTLRTRAANVAQLAVVASRDHAGPMVSAMLSRLPGAATLSMGSSLKFCLVAEGRADIYLRDVPTMEWDTAAAHCVVAAAGGSLLTLDGEPLRYGKPDLKNPSILTLGDAALPWRRYLA